MRLTPAEVHNVAFKKPSIGKRGYDEDEVDAFLDLVEAEFSRLIEENNELTQRLAAQSVGMIAGSGFEQPAGQAPQYRNDAAGQQVEQPRREEVAQPVIAAVAPVPVQPAQPYPDAGPAPHHVQAAILLGHAQETADRVVGEATAQAEATRSSAKAESDQLLGNVHFEVDRLVSEAQQTSETLVTDATAKAEALERDSRIRADALDREAQSKYSQVMSQLTEQRSTLEKKIDDLRVYEREYRSRLKSWITDQLSQLSEGTEGASDQLAHQGAE